MTDVSGRRLPARVVLHDESGAVAPPFDIPRGQASISPPQGSFRAFVYIYDEEVPVLAAIENLTVTADATSALQVNILEGASGKLGIRDFDLDGDLAIDRVELEAGTGD